MPRRPMTIRAALDWAFATEKAQLDFAEAKGDNARPGVSTIWTIMQRGHLGCSVDGGGYSLPHLDADIIASAVANLPRGLGGRGMALIIAEAARACAVPDWRTEAPQWVPVAWKGENQNGRQAATRVVDVLVFTRRGRKVEVPILCCPIRRTVSPDRVLAVRARYTAWRAALAWLLSDLSRRGALSDIALVGGLPVAEPWVQQERIAQAA